MRIGFASIYSWRPHVEHIYFLARLAQKAGHEAVFLTCDGDLPNCYTRELRARHAGLECALCRAAGIRSYTSSGVTSIGELLGRSSRTETPAEWAHSSASTLGRFESDADYQGGEFAKIVERLKPVVAISNEAAREWITQNRLEAVCVFNGRMDATRAILEAARSLGVRVVSVERTWFGDGLQLYPDESCLGLRSVHKLVSAWKDAPLLREQALRAAEHVAGRFLRSNHKEWRAYNVNAQTVPWPDKSATRKILLIPSSRNEVWSHPDWEPKWRDPIEAYDALIARFNLQPAELVLRCHPNWGEMIGVADGRRAETHYADWAKSRSIHCIASTDRASTLGLIEQCDAIVVANGSAAMEAGFLGKQIIGIAPSIYQCAEMRDEACDAADVSGLELWSSLASEERVRRAAIVMRQTLRFLYTMIYRIPQYTSFVRAVATTRYRYDFSADPRRFIELLHGGELCADDETAADSAEAESAVLALIRDRRWDQLRPSDHGLAGELRGLPRRFPYRIVDIVARHKPVGDR